MWTLQESVLGRHVTVHCGAKRVQMPYFFEFSYFLFLAMAYHPRFSFESLPGDVALRAVFRMADLRDHIGGRGYVPTLLAVDSSWNRAASDDKDKIMALLGLVSWRSSLRPEYDWDIGRVYQAAINNIVMEEGNLGFLGLISEAQVLRRPDLPSWIPTCAFTPSTVVIISPHFPRPSFTFLFTTPHWRRMVSGPRYTRKKTGPCSSFAVSYSIASSR